LTPANDVDFELLRLAALLESDAAAAARGAAQIVRRHPDHAPAALLLGRAHRGCGDAQAAVAEFTALATTQPQSAVIRLELARALRDAGRAPEARRALEQALALQPELAPAWRELSLLHAAAGDTVACDLAYARFSELSDEDAPLGEAAAALANERLSAAESLLQRALARSPEDVAALRMLAEVMAARENYAEAARLLGECLRRAPGYARARLDLVQLWCRQQRGEPMLAPLERLLAAEPANLRYRTLQAVACNLVGEGPRALQILRDLAGEFPADEHVWLQYGHTLRAAGEQAGAIDAYRRCVALRPACGAAWFALANLKTLRFTAADVETMEGELARTQLRHEDRVHLEFALGKAREDGGDFGAAFAHYARGNDLRRTVVRYDREYTTRFAERTRTLYTREFFAARTGWGRPSAEPIFIVGLPRAGSTLLEQILASHSQIEGTRELTDMLVLAVELGARVAEVPGGTPDYPQSVARLTRAQVSALADRYLAQTRAYRRLGRPYFIDKMGSNFLNVGLIHLMLPNARIIDARRAALSCCFANYRQHFQGVSFTNSFEDLARYYRDYVDVMAHFDHVLPGRIHRVSYERLVADFEVEVARLLDYCGVPFEQQCLRFHETQRAVQTVSSEQVRQPLYTEGLELWRNFEPWLGPLRQALGDLAAPQPASVASVALTSLVGVP